MFSGDFVICHLRAGERGCFVSGEGFHWSPGLIAANILAGEGYRKELQKVNNDSCNNLECLKLIILLWW
jgi:hypothetical protein